MKLLRRILFLLVYHFYAKRKMQSTDRISLLGFRLTIVPTVFHPALFYSSKLLGEYVLGLDLNGKLVLDMGTGSGIIGMCAAKAGASVHSVDVNPAALHCAESNAVDNGLIGKILYYESDLFSNVDRTQKFDFIIWNPPFYPLQAFNYDEQAWNAGFNYSVIRRFAETVRDYLIPNGSVLLVLSTDQDLQVIESFFADEGYSINKVADKQTLFETLTVYRFV